MAKVVWQSGIEYVSGALCKCGKNGQHTHEKMLLATHRVAETENPNCNRLYLRKKVERSTPVTADELARRDRFVAVARAVNMRAKDLTKMTADKEAFLAQKDISGGKKTMKAWYWMVCGDEYDNENPRD